MFDLNISKNFDLIITNKNPTTAFTPLLEEWLYLKRLIERAEIHFNKNEMYEEIFSYELYVGMDDEEIEDTGEETPVEGAEEANEYTEEDIEANEETDLANEPVEDFETLDKTIESMVGITEILHTLFVHHLQNLI
jgi:hypothetical protein